MNRIAPFPENEMEIQAAPHWDRQPYFRSKSSGAMTRQATRETEDGERLAGRSSSLTNPTNEARQMAVNFMPSRQLTHLGNTVKLRRNKSEDIVLLDELVSGPDDENPTMQRANAIARELGRDDSLMEDNPESEQLRLDALRELPQNITLKRSVRAKLSASVSLRSKRKPISLSKQMKYRWSFAMKKLKENLKNFIFSVELWYDTIRLVEGQFGSAIATYFYFLRWLFLMNVAVSVAVMSFIVVPQLLNQQTNDTIATRTDDVQNSSSGIAAVFLDIVSGQGLLENTILFYGQYTPSIINSHGQSTFNMAYSYFFTMVTVYILFFMFLCVRLANLYRRSFIETAGGLHNAFAVRVFCGWDFGIATPQGASLKSKTIYNELKELLNESVKGTYTNSACYRWCLLGWRFLAHSLALATVVGSGALVWWLLSLRNQRTEDYWSLAAAAIVTAVTTVAPEVFSLLVRLEKYRSPRTTLYMTLGRTFALDMVVVLVILTYWLRSSVECWETAIGQEVYRLIVVDIVCSLIIIPLYELIRAGLNKCCSNIPQPEFDIARDTLVLIHNQSLLWLGLFFSPPLAVLVCIKLALLLYVRRASLHAICRAPARSWRAAQTHTVFLMLCFASLLGALVAFGYVFLKASSKGCGPFQDYDYVYQLVTDGVLELKEGSTFFSVVMFITRPGAVGFVLIFLCAVVYYVRARSHAQRSMVGILREMLVLETKDKEFLLSAIGKVSDGEWVYNKKNIAELSPDGDSHTWRYLNNDRVRRPSNANYQLERSHTSGMQNAVISGEDSLVRNSPFEEGDTDNSSFSWQGSTGYLRGLQAQKDAAFASNFSQ